MARPSIRHADLLVAVQHLDRNPDALDPVAIWGDAHARVCAMVLALDEAQAALTAPATPAWTVRELLAHMVGLGSDVLAGREDPDHGPDWTASQVRARSGATIADLVSEWRAVSDPLQEHMRRHGARPLADLMIHEQDLRGAVGRPGAEHDPGHAWVSAQMLGRVRDALDGGPALALVTPGATWTSVAGAGGDPAVADVELRAPGFDLARALTSRRTHDQLVAWTVRGDLDSVLTAFTLLGPPPERALPC